MLSSKDERLTYQHQRMVLIGVVVGVAPEVVSLLPFGLKECVEFKRGACFPGLMTLDWLDFVFRIPPDLHLTS